MKLNKKGAALMQVLLITVILAGIATMLLRATLSRTTSARKTRRAASAQVLIQGCMAQVNTLWSKKTPEAFRRDLAGDADGPFMYCKGTGTGTTCPTSDIVREYVCTVNDVASPYSWYSVRAYFEKDATANDGKMWQLTYEIINGSTNL